MNQQLFVNNFAAILSSPITDQSTSITLLPTGIGAQLPSLNNGDYILLTLTQADTETSWEVVKVTGIAGDTLFISRAIEGSAQAWAAGSKAEVRIPAGYLNVVSALIPLYLPFQTEVPLNRYRTIFQTFTVSSPITFTSPTSTLEGSMCVYSLVGDGVNTPDFSNFDRHSSDAGYVNTAGTLNLVTFLRFGGKNMYSVSQGGMETFSGQIADFSDPANSGLLAVFF